MRGDAKDTNCFVTQAECSIIFSGFVLQVVEPECERVEPERTADGAP